MSGCSRWNSAGGLPETSNCYCHPGIAGGLPLTLEKRACRAHTGRFISRSRELLHENRGLSHENRKFLRRHVFLIRSTISFRQLLANSSEPPPPRDAPTPSPTRANETYQIHPVLSNADHGEMALQPRAAPNMRSHSSFNSWYSQFRSGRLRRRKALHFDCVGALPPCQRSYDN